MVKTEASTLVPAATLAVHIEVFPWRLAISTNTVVPRFLLAEETVAATSKHQRHQNDTDDDS